MTAQHQAPTDVLILGVNHWGAEVSDDAIETTRRKLLAWRPDAVCIQRLSTQLWAWISQLRDEDRTHAPDLPCWAHARDAAAAIADEHRWSLREARRIALDPASTRADRVAAFIAAYEPENALLHADGTPLAGTVARVVEAYRAMPSERVRLGAWLGRQLGHERLWFCDDRTHEEIPPPPGEAPALTSGTTMQPVAEACGREETDALAAADLWPALVRWNSAEGQAVLEQLVTQAWLADGPPAARREGRLDLAQWRARNLHMAANVRAATGHFPGGRVLMIVGASHVRPMRAALGVDQHDIRLVDLAELD